MHTLLLSDLAIVLPHLLDEKAQALERTLCGTLYRPLIVAQLRTIEVLPTASSSMVSRPLAEALTEAELRIDTIALLSDLRTAVADELTEDPAALHQLDAELFAFIDELIADRAATLRRRAMPTTVVAPASVLGDGASRGPEPAMG
jgi:hypothetical protein